jgi:hypothetical protein
MVYYIILNGNALRYTNQYENTNRQFVLLPSFTLKMEAAGSSELSVPLQETTWYQESKYMLLTI